jgi:arachidonate 15-lipoxygenase
MWNATQSWVTAYISAVYKNDVKRLQRDTEIATAIFTASAQHAAVNFPQATLMLYAPAFPLCLYSSPPEDATMKTEDAWLNLLAPAIVATTQVRSMPHGLAYSFSPM